MTFPKKTNPLIASALTLSGIYLMIFHTDPFPFNHEAIGLPPYHTLHAIFGFIFLAASLPFWSKMKMK